MTEPQKNRVAINSLPITYELYDEVVENVTFKTLDELKAKIDEVDFAMVCFSNCTFEFPLTPEKYAPAGFLDCTAAIPGDILKQVTFEFEQEDETPMPSEEIPEEAHEGESLNLLENWDIPDELVEKMKATLTAVPVSGLASSKRKQKFPDRFAELFPKPANGPTAPGMGVMFDKDDLQVDSQTGAMKADRNKLRYDLLPPEPLEAYVRILTHGAAKYGDRNWEKGMAWTRLFASAQRHLWAWRKGETLDPDSGENHLAHAICNLMFLLEYATTHEELDDR